MENNTFHLSTNPFPAVPAGLTRPQQAALLALEARLIARQPRTLVVVEPEQLPLLLTISVDRLLHFAAQRILILTGISLLKSEVTRWWRAGTSPIDGYRFIDHYRTQYAPSPSLAPETRLCISTLREIQLSIHEEKLAQEEADLVLVYRPMIASHILQQALDAFTVPCIGWSDTPNDGIRTLFGNNVVEMSGTQQISHT